MTRLQIACYNKLVGEVIVKDYKQADEIWTAYSWLRYRRNEPQGCCAIYSSEITRLWDVPVGSTIKD